MMMSGLEVIDIQYPYTSIFPDGIDERTFFHDVGLSDLSLMTMYGNLISDSKFTNAAIFLSQQNGLHNYSADLFNFIEAKIFAWQKNISEKEKYNPFHSSSTEPDIPVGEIWIDT